MTAPAASPNRMHEVLHVADARERLGADRQHAAGAAGRDVGLRDRERGDEPGAGRVAIEGRGVHRAQAVLDDRGAGRDHLIRRDRADDDEVEVLGREPRRLERAPPGDHGHVRGRLAVGDVAPLADPRALDDPLVRRVDDLLEVRIRDDALGHVGTRTGDADADA